MHWPPRVAVRSSSVALIAATLLGGCSAFTGSKRVDVSPFSENTVGMLAEVQRFNRPVNWVYLRKYQNLPSVNAARLKVLPIRTLLRGVGLYSTQVVSLYDSPLSEDRKISELARYMTDYIRPSLADADSSSTGFTIADLDHVVGNIRTSKTFLAALSAAQPLVNATVARGNAMFDEVEGLVQVATADVNERVEAEYAPLKRNMTDLESLHEASIHSYALIQRMRQGEAGALDSLRQQDPAAAGTLPAGKAPGAKDLDAVERYVSERTNTVETMRRQLDPQLEIYRASIAEMEDLRAQTDDRAKLGRMTLLLWGRSHRNLAAGISIKPMIDVMGIVKSTVATGAKGVLP